MFDSYQCPFVAPGLLKPPFPTFDGMTQSLAERDKKVIWHPYTPQKYSPDPIPIVEGHGAWLIDENNNRYLDAISSWWVTAHGHANEYIASKIYQQALKLEQVIFAGFTHSPAVELAERLLGLLPGNFSKIFFSDNGSTATEVAVKMALQYWRNKGKPRNRILALTHAYHGDTFGAMSFSERGIFTDAFKDQLFEVDFVELPIHGESLATDILESLQRLLPQCACIIYEPLIQGAGGMLMHTPDSLDAVLDHVRTFEVICIADEVMTGFGRTGKLFASSFTKNKPDIICLSKGLTGGSMAMGVTACTTKIHEAFVDPDILKTFFHGHSYTANPIACAAALASLDLFSKKETIENIERICTANLAFEKQLNQLAEELNISSVRCTGTIIAFEVNTIKQGYTSNIRDTITKLGMEEGVYLRPLGNTVYIMPPYCITSNELNQVYNVLLNILKKVKGSDQ